MMGRASPLQADWRLPPPCQPLPTLLIACLAWSIGLAAVDARGQNRRVETPQYVRTQWTAANGLPANSVNDIAQTPDGYLWLATGEGLVRFDGLEFEEYPVERSTSTSDKHIPSFIVDIEPIGTGPNGTTLVAHTTRRHLLLFRNGSFEPLAEDVYTYDVAPNGAVWLGTSRGVSVYRNGQVERVAPQRIQAEVRRLTYTDGGTLWVGTLRQGAYRRDEEGTVEQFTTTEGLATNRVTAFAEAPNGTVWVGTWAGLHRWTGRTFDRITSPTPAPLQIFQVRAGVGPAPCWARTNRGVYRCEDGLLVPFANAGPERAPPTNFRVPQFVQEGPKGRVFVNTETALFRNGTKFLDSGGTLRSVFHDRQGTTWLGTGTEGLIQLRRAAVTTYGRPEGLPSNEISTVLQRRDGSMWMGTVGGSLVHFREGDPRTYDLRKEPVLVEDIWTLHEDRSGQLWVGGWHLLCRFEAGNCASPTPPDPIPADAYVAAVYEDRENRLWIGTLGDGLFRRSSGGSRQPQWAHFTPENSGLSGRNVRYIHESPSGALWFGTMQEGLARYRNGRFRTLGPDVGLSDASVKHVYQDTTGILWVGTEGGGLNRVDLRGADSLGAADITVYRERDGLYQNEIHQILEDEQGRLWMNTNNGLFWVRKQNLNTFAQGEIDHIRSVPYGLRDGLRNVEGSGYGMPSAIKAQDGRLWFPTLGGAAVVNPRRLGDHTSPLVHVKALTTGNRSLFEGTWGGIPDTSLSLSADQRTFTIQYAGIYLRDPNAVEYRYRLRDMQEEWVRAQSRREVTFSEVPPGRYTFEVLARAEGGSWSKEPAQLTVTVAPYFYETWWFYGLCIALLGAIGYGGIQYRLYALRRREALLEETVAERTQELQERERELKRENERLDRFASVLSHDLRNPLNVAQGRLQLAREKFEKDPEGHLSSAGRALGRMDEILEDMLLLTWSEREIDPEDVKVVDLKEAGRKAWESVEAPQATLEVESSARLTAHEGRLRRLLENLFRNAVEHGGAGVSISVGPLPEGKPPNGGLSHGESPAGFFVEDDGPGIPEEKREKVLEGGYSSREEGTGLGLSIVQGIAEAHGWSISVTEGREGGARFEFRGAEMPGG